MYGTGANTYLNSIIGDLLYESLLQLHPETLEFVPGLASHWKISEDQMTFTFRINPRARWSDGKPVTADDILATWKLTMDETLIDPMTRTNMDEFEEPVVLSKYMLEVKCRNRNWRNFITFASAKILPAHEIGVLSGKEYLDKYNFSYTAVSGPYIIHKADIKNNESITITRRSDYWGADVKSNQGLFNIDKIRFVVIRDQRLAFDKACKGELDFLVVYTAKWWVEDIAGLEAVAKGHLIRQKVFTRYPEGFQGLAFNERKPPVDDLRVRKAIAHLYARRRMLEKFAYNEYEPLASYYPNSDAANPDNQLVEYVPQEATRLLAQAGWKERGDDGILRKVGKRLSVTLSYRSKGLDKYFTSFKEDLKQAGVELKLNLLTPETAWKNAQERNFELMSMAWGAILFPNPRTSYHSEMANQEGSNNITGFASDRADELIEQYEQEFDLTRRTELLSQLDAEIFKDHPYALAWFLPCQRVLYWNKFGTPQTILPKYADWRSVFLTWWVDPSKEQKLRQARDTGEGLLPIPPVEVRPWDGPPREAAKPASSVSRH